MSNSRRVFINTGVMYLQLIVKTIIALLTTRYILKSLGQEDFGIYMLVAGVVSTLSVLSSSMTNTSMRYMAHSLGKGDDELSTKTFNTTLYLHYVIAIVLAIILEIGGFIMFEYIIDIPTEKIFAAKVVYQFMIATAVTTIISTPYDAVINSHEDIYFLSIVDVFGYILQLVLAICMLYMDSNLLIIYGFVMMLIQILLRSIKQVYSRRKYLECKINFKKYRDSALTKEIMSFTGWELFRSLAALCTTQLRGILLNVFFGVTLNAAEGVAKKVQANVNQVSTGLSRAITPQMMKSEGNSNRGRMIQLMYVAIKYTTFLFSLVAIPILIESPFLFNVWLGEVPEFAIIFCQLLLLTQLLDKLTWQVGNAIRAVGKIKQYQIAEGVLAMMFVPLSYIVLKLGGDPVSVFIVQIVIVLLTSILRLYYGKKIAEINPASFIRKTTIPIIVPIFIALICVLPLRYYMEESFIRLIIISILFMGVNFIAFWSMYISKEEKGVILSNLKIITSKLK